MKNWNFVNEDELEHPFANEMILDTGEHFKIYYNNSTDTFYYNCSKTLTNEDVVELSADEPVWYDLYMSCELKIDELWEITTGLDWDKKHKLMKEEISNFIKKYLEKNKIPFRLDIPDNEAFMDDL